MEDFSTDTEAVSMFTWTSAVSAATDRGGLTPPLHTSELAECETASVAAAAAALADGTEVWGSPAKSSLMCSRQKSSAGAEPTHPVRSKAITHLRRIRKMRAYATGHAQAARRSQPVREAHVQQLLEKGVGDERMPGAP